MKANAFVYQSMTEYEYIDQYVHVAMLLTMVLLIIELDDYAMIPVLYCDAKEKRSNEFIVQMNFSQKERSVQMSFVHWYAMRKFQFDHRNKKIRMEALGSKLHSDSFVWKELS